MKNICISALLLFTSLSVFAQNTSFEINEKLGRGVNFGNMFESDISGGWGAAVYPYYFQEIADKGFNSIRVPIKWSDYALTDSPYTIEQKFIDTIKTVVDLALENKLMVIINMHHYDEIFSDPDAHTIRYLAIWSQISEAFKGYSDSLLFELLNEPHDMLDQAKWNLLFPMVLDTVRQKNITRKLIIGPPDWNSMGSVDKLVWPESDTNLIMTVHYYNPFHFTHQGASWVDGADAWLGTTWDSTATELQAVINDCAATKSFSDTKNVPVYVGEFGAYSTADMESRKKWTAYMARTFESFGFSWAYWEFKAGFGVYDSGNGIWKNELLNALTEQTDPNSIPPEPWEIGNSDFTRGLNGWSFYFQGGAAATATVNNEEAVVDVTVATDNSWHIQLLQTGVELIQGAEYQLTFDARTELPPGVLKSYLGKSSDPYTNYSGSHEYTLTESTTNYSYTFSMNDFTDANSRVVFDLSYVATKIYIDNVVLELLSLPTLVEQITLGPTSAEISVQEGSLQLSATVEPEDATSKSIKWEVVSGANLATVSTQGLVRASGAADGSSTIRATARDGSGIYSEIVIDISNQTIGWVDQKLVQFNAMVIDQRIEYSIPASEEARSINLYSIDGRKIFAGSIPPSSGSGSIAMDQFESNIYILEVSGEDSREILKIIY